MRLHRFYIDKQIGKEIRIDDKDLLNQWKKVFRFEEGDRVIVFNGGDFEYEGVFKMLSKSEAILEINKEIKVKKPTNIDLHIFQSIIKKDNFELVVEKCTEIGVVGFHPIVSERSEKKDLNLERLIKIAKEASEQSGKTRLPEIFNPESLEKAILDFDGDLFALDFDGGLLKDRLVLDIDNKIGILVGPEGGWSDRERLLFEQKGIQSISLGSQILRAETASIAISSLILLK